MTWVAAATIGSAVVGAGASIYGSNQAAGAMASSARDAARVNQQIYNQNRSDLAPYRDAGTASLDAVNRLNGIPMDTSYRPSRTYSEIGKATEYDIVSAFQEFLGRAPTKVERKYYSKRQRADQLYNDVVRPGIERLTQEQAAAAPQTASPEGPANPNDPENRYGGFYASPSYNFVLDEGLRGQDRNYAARGLMNSGARARAGTRYAADVASGEFGNYYNRLAGVATQGQNAATNTMNANNAYNNNASNNINNQGMARASGYLGTTGAISSGINNVLAAMPYWAGTRRASVAPPTDAAGYTNLIWPNGRP